MVIDKVTENSREVNDSKEILEKFVKKHKVKGKFWTLMNSEEG